MPHHGLQAKGTPEQPPRRTPPNETLLSTDPEQGPPSRDPQVAHRNDAVFEQSPASSEHPTPQEEAGSEEEL